MPFNPEDWKEVSKCHLADVEWEDDRKIFHVCTVCKKRCITEVVKK